MIIIAALMFSIFFVEIHRFDQFGGTYRKFPYSPKWVCKKFRYSTTKYV